jgi:hypothetical protein
MKYLKMYLATQSLTALRYSSVDCIERWWVSNSCAASPRNTLIDTNVQGFFTPRNGEAAVPESMMLLPEKR